MKLKRVGYVQQLENIMKNFLLVITILFTAVIVNANGNTMQTDVNENATVKSESLEPIYWQGWASTGSINYSNQSLYITVYRTQNQCDAFYAIATKFRGCNHTTQDINVNLVVREDRDGKYFVSYDGRKYYFRM